MPLPLVLLPGMSCSPRLWHGVVQELAADRPGDRGRPVVVPEIDRATLDDQVESLLDRLPPRFALGGLSLGAIVAMAVHRRAPERVAGLFLVATNARPPTDAQRTGWAAQLDALAAGASPRDLQEELLPLLVGSGPGARPGRPGTGAGRRGRGTDPAGAAELQSTRVDERPGLAAAAVPCTVVAAAEDRICPLERHTEIHDLAAGSELVVVPGAPHLVALTHPHRWPTRLGPGYAGSTTERSAGGSAGTGGNGQVCEDAHDHLCDVVDHEPAARREDASASSALPASSARHEPTSSGLPVGRRDGVRDRRIACSGRGGQVGRADEVAVDPGECRGSLPRWSRPAATPASR